MRAFFYSAFLFRNGQNAIPSILLPGAEWTECCGWKSKMAVGEMSAADSNTSLPEKKSGYTFGHNETLLLISLYQKYEFFQWCFVQEKGRTRTAHLDGRFFMQTIRIIPSIPYQPFLFQNCGLKNAPLEEELYTAIQHKYSKLTDKYRKEIKLLMRLKMTEETKIAARSGRTCAWSWG